MLRIRTVALLLSLLSASTGTLATAGESAVRWQGDIDAALATAAQTNRLVLVHFWRPTCQPCMRLDANVFSQPQFAAALEADYVPVKINTDQFPITARRYGVEMLPADVILTPDGKVATTASCPQDSLEYADRLRQTAASIRRANGQFAQADRAAASRDATRDAPATYAQHAPREDFGRPRVTATESYNTESYKTDSYNADSYSAKLPAASNQPYASERRYADEFDAQRPPVATAQYRGAPSYSDAAAPPATPRMTTRDVPPTNSPAQTPARAPAAMNDTGLPYGNPNPTAGLPTTPPPSADYTPRVPATPAANAPLAQPSLCLEGHCPVTLMDTQRWTPGDRRFGAVHRGRLYLFGSSDAQQRFLANPDKYSPAISGHDAVAWVERGQLIHGERKFGGYFRGYIYLFANEESLRQFEANPERYAAPVEQAVAAGRGQGQSRR